MVASIGSGGSPYAGINVGGGLSGQDLLGSSQFGQALNQQKQLAQMPFDWARQKFNTILPMLQGALGGQGGVGSVPVTNAMTPINTSPIWNDQQIQGRVNQMRGANDASTASQIRQSGESLAGRGFGSNSPLQAALANQAQGMNRMANTQGENDIRWNAAQGNRQMVAQTQQAAANQALGQGQLAVEAQKPWWQRQNVLISALAGLA